MLVQLKNNESIDLRILDLDRLAAHEEIIPSLLNSVSDGMRFAQCQKDPILVDPSLNLVLDGMHRLAALRREKAKLALCACYDYFDRRIVLERWLRYFALPDEVTLQEVIELFALKSSDGPFEAMKAANDDESPAALLSKDHSYLSTGNFSIQELYQRIGVLDSLLAKKKINTEFRANVEIQDLLTVENSEYLLYPRHFTKNDVIQVARSGKLFPYKTTRHIVPIRPVSLNFPLHFLKEGSIGSSESELSNLLSQGSFELLEEGFLYEGRRYSEQLAIFSEK